MQAAKKALSDALVAREGYVEAHIALGDVYRKEGDANGAAAEYRQALPFLDDELQRAEVEQLLGSLYLELGQLDKAVRELRKVGFEQSRRRQVTRAARTGAGAASTKRGETPGSPTWDAARQCLLKAARADTADPQVLTTLGKLLLSSGTSARCGKSAPARGPGCRPERVETLLLFGELRLFARRHRVGLRARSARLWQCRQAGNPTMMAEAHRHLARCHAKVARPNERLQRCEKPMPQLPPMPVS